MRDETKKEPETLDVSVEAGALIASGLTVKLARHDEKLCAPCSEFTLHFLTNDKSTFRFTMQGSEFKDFYEAMGRALEKVGETIEKES
jgi:hypothetical protein